MGHRDGLEGDGPKEGGEAGDGTGLERELVMGLWRELVMGAEEGTGDGTVEREPERGLGRGVRV